MPPCAPGAPRTKRAKRSQRVTENDRLKIDSVVKHVGLKRGAVASQKYVVRGVFIDSEGVKRFCLHDVDDAPIKLSISLILEFKWICRIYV